MRDQLNRLDNTRVALITFTDATNLESYRDQHDLPFPVLTDPTRASYQAYGLGSGAFGRVWGIKSARAYFRIIKRDGWSRLQSPTEDTRQLGGDFVISPDGTLAWGFWSEGPADRPTVEAIIHATKKVNL